jgi:hypothetical protein
LDLTWPTWEVPRICEEFSDLWKKYGVSGLLDLYFLNKQDQHPAFATLEPRFRILLADQSLRDDFLEFYQGSLLSVLNDSLVDLGTKFRILFIREFNPATLQALIYMWHPEALDTFDGHLGPLSDFVDHYKKMPRGGDDMWRTSITLSHWRLRNIRQSKIHNIEAKVEDDE